MSSEPRQECECLTWEEHLSGACERVALFPGVTAERALDAVAACAVAQLAEAVTDRRRKAKSKARVTLVAVSGGRWQR